jgi:hypothetical protein
MLAVSMIASSAWGEPASKQPSNPPWPAPPPPPVEALGSTVPATSALPPPNTVPVRRRASNFESGLLYTAAAVWGIGVGVWLDAELRLGDPAALLVPPSLLGVASPIVAYAANQPRMDRGVPGAIAAGLLIGAGEGMSIASYQMFTADNPWGLHGLGRAMVIGSTAGGLTGITVGVMQEPSPNISSFAISGVIWGYLVGSAFGLGASQVGVGFSQANDSMALGGLIGFNAGLVVTMGLSTEFVPTLGQLSGMWAGAGIGALVSLPVYLFYLGPGAHPQRGLVFSATATTLGIVVGGLVGSRHDAQASADEASGWASVDYLLPMPVPGGMGLQLGGSLF